MRISTAATVALALTAPFAGVPVLTTQALLAQTPATTAESVHAMERARMGLGPLRAGPDGDTGKPNSANYDETKVGNLPLPPLFAGQTPPNAHQWPLRREELLRLVEDNWIGRIPDSVARFSIAWRKEATGRTRRSQTEHWIGQIATADGRMGPVIDAIVTFPRTAAAKPAPALIDYTYIWPSGRMPQFDGPPAPNAVAQALDHGFAHVTYRPQLLQADGAATMDQGIIGLARWPRDTTDWGALRAWAWGASQLRAELAKDPRINAQRISLQGHSRFGKSVLVAAAFDPEFADANVSASGAGGSKLMRRDFGERWENMAGTGAFHWFAPAIMRYAAGSLSVANLPVDAHTLIALRAPRPLFLTSGTAENGDAWVDPRGMWQALRAASPAWDLYGLPIAHGPMPAAGSSQDAGFTLGWYQHTEGHIPWPGTPAFYAHEARMAKARENAQR